MPTPAFILCSQIATPDPGTGALMAINLIEVIRLVPPTVPATPLPPLPQGLLPLSGATVTASWLRDPEDDPKQDYEVQIGLHIPGRPEGEYVPVAETVIRFEGRTRRVIIDHVPLRGLHEAKTLQIEAKLRKRGEEKWEPKTSQFYRIALEVFIPPAQDQTTVTRSGLPPNPAQPLA
jgi:hypothetical protein